jgi:GTP pyrophosphokinase
MASFSGRQKAGWRRVLQHTLAEMPSLSWGIDPRTQLYGRVKSVASISFKMYINGIGAHQVLDIIGIRAITRHTRDCYRLVHRIHSAFEVIETQCDDYIAAPKPNGYRSIHTTVISPSGLAVEIQIRTNWMHELCKRGPAAHDQYKRNRIAWMALPNGPFSNGDLA